MRQTDTNAELLRLYYLQQLGISSWLPRVMLPGACIGELSANSSGEMTDEVADEVADEVKAESTGELQTQVDAAPVPQPEIAMKPAIVSEPERVINKPLVARQSIIDERAPTPLASATPSQRISATTSETSGGQTMSPFQILFVVLGRELAVAVQIPATMKPALRDADARLLANVLRWLGFTWPVQGAPLQFRWPLPSLPAGGAEQAGKGLRAFFHQAAQEQPFRHLVVFGSEPSTALRASEMDTPDLWQIWSTHSLAELLAVPALKQETWQMLLPLRMQLSS